MTVSAETQVSSTEYLTVSLKDDVFALPVELVREVLDPPAMTAVPNAPYYAPGLINVRGNVVPLVDLRLRLGSQPGEDTPNTRVIVSEVSVNGESFLVAMKADAVMEVVAVRGEEVETMPEHGCRWSADLLSGVVRHGDEFVMLLNVQEIFRQEIQAVQ